MEKTYHCKNNSAEGPRDNAAVAAKKRLVCPIALFVLAAVAAPVSVYFADLAIWINCFPPVLWGLFLLLCHARWKLLQDHKAVFLGLIYGILGAVAVASFFVWVTANVFATPYMRYPYDSAAGGILLVLFGLLVLGLAIFDYCKYGMKPFWPRLVTALVTVAPATLLSLCVMEYFERILSQYVS